MVAYTASIMEVSPNQVPDRLVKEVSFEDRLLEFALGIELDEQEAVDKFWTSLYFARLPAALKTELADGVVELLGIEVLPSDYNEQKLTINVLLKATWFDNISHEKYMGPSIYMTLGSDGTLTDERSAHTMRYSPQFIGHIQLLLAHTQLAYSAVEPINK